jgi:hypothetical protein
VERHVDEHLGPQREIAVADLEAHSRRARLARERGSSRRRGPSSVAPAGTAR